MSIALLHEPGGGAPGAGSPPARQPHQVAFRAHVVIAEGGEISRVAHGDAVELAFAFRADGLAGAALGLGLGALASLDASPFLHHLLDGIPRAGTSFRSSHWINLLSTVSGLAREVQLAY